MPPLSNKEKLKELNYVNNAVNSFATKDQVTSLKATLKF